MVATGAGPGISSFVDAYLASSKDARAQEEQKINDMVRGLQILDLQRKEQAAQQEPASIEAAASQVGTEQRPYFAPSQLLQPPTLPSAASLPPGMIAPPSTGSAVSDVGSDAAAAMPPPGQPQPPSPPGPALQMPPTVAGYTEGKTLAGATRALGGDKMAQIGRSKIASDVLKSSTISEEEFKQREALAQSRVSFESFSRQAEGALKAGDPAQYFLLTGRAFQSLASAQKTPEGQANALKEASRWNDKAEALLTGKDGPREMALAKEDAANITAAQESRDPAVINRAWTEVKSKAFRELGYGVIARGSEKDLASLSHARATNEFFKAVNETMNTAAQKGQLFKIYAQGREETGEIPETTRQGPGQRLTFDQAARLTAQNRPDLAGGMLSDLVNNRLSTGTAKLVGHALGIEDDTIKDPKFAVAVRIAKANGFDIDDPDPQKSKAAGDMALKVYRENIQAEAQLRRDPTLAAWREWQIKNSGTKNSQADIRLLQSQAKELDTAYNLALKAVNGRPEKMDPRTAARMDENRKSYTNIQRQIAEAKGTTQARPTIEEFITSNNPMRTSLDKINRMPPGPLRDQAAQKFKADAKDLYQEFHGAE